MRKITATLLASLAFVFGLAGVASATDVCSIVNTGSNSNNQCTVTEENDIKIVCKNDVDVVFVNGQNANSGSSAVLNNTNGGYSFSGNAVNTNQTTGQLDVSCAPAQQAVTPPAPTPPPAGGQGAAVQGAVTTAPAPTAVKALPNTGDTSLVSFVASSLAALVAMAAVGYVGVSLYRRAALK